MPEKQTISAEDVAVVSADELREEPRKVTPSRIRSTVTVPSSVRVVVPTSARIDWGTSVTDPDGTQHEAAVTSVTVHGLGDVAEHRRGVGDLALPPAADLDAAAEEIRACKTFEDVAVAVTRLLAAGVKR